MSRPALTVAAALCAFTLAAADKLPKADRIAEPPTAQQRALIREGVALHDQKRYDDAIAKYRRVLAENPWEVNALHELSFTYFEKKRYVEALDTARAGARCKSDRIAKFYMMMASALDELGKPRDAVDVYRAAIKLNPTLGLLHYNLGISLKRAGKAIPAKAAIERGLQCDPGHASSHAVLGQMYQEMGYRIPAIMAYSRFLLLEPASPRSAKVLPVLERLLTQGVGVGKEPGNITIVLGDPGKGKKDEGDFSGMEVTLSLLIAADLIEKPDDAKLPAKTQFQKLAGIYSSLAGALEIAKPKGGFAATYYAPYFAAIEKAGHTEALAASAWLGADVEGASDWRSSNASKVATFGEWSRAYAWPSK